MKISHEVNIARSFYWYKKFKEGTLKTKPPNITLKFTPLEGTVSKLTGEINGKVWTCSWMFQNMKDLWFSDLKRYTVEEIKKLLTPREFIKFKRGRLVFIKEKTREMKYEAVKTRYQRRRKKKCS